VLLVPGSILIKGADVVVLAVVRIRLETHGVADIVGYHSVVGVSHRGAGLGLPVGNAGVVQPGGGVMGPPFSTSLIVANIPNLFHGKTILSLI